MLSKRIQQVAESVLENEALISGLDRSSAEVLQSWGVKKATQVAEKTAALDDERAEKEMYLPLKASRRLIRAIRIWLEYEEGAEPAEREKLWAKIEKRAKVLYGEGISLPSPSEFSGETPVEFINNLRNWLEEGENLAKKKEKKDFFSSLFGR